MKFSVVTISFNQAKFLERAISSVLCQEGPEVEYIIVDPGSTDGSRELIERYRDQFAHVILEPDRGPADGLNKGFGKASGEIYCYLNSDDTFEVGAFARVERYFLENPAVDVVCGHAWVIDASDSCLRRVWSEPFRRLMVAYSAAVQIQPSTFIRSSAFRRTGGFNIENKSNWDGELLVDIFNSGAKIAVVDEILSSYRLHDVSITNSGSHDARIAMWRRRRFAKLMTRNLTRSDELIAFVLRYIKHITNPLQTFERIRFGRIYKRGV